jgi:peroxiredoxin
MMNGTLRAAAHRLAMLIALISTATDPATALAGGLLQEGAPWLGVELQPGRAGGVGLKRVLEDAPGERAHLRPGDEVVSVDGERVTTPEELMRAVHGKAVGALVRLALAGTPAREVLVKLESRPRPADYQRRALVDKPAPDFAAAVRAGPALKRLSSLRGQVVLLDFFASWCMPCMAELPRLEALSRELGPSGLRVVGVSDEAPERIAAVTRRGVSYTLVSDPGGEISARYHVSALPTLVLVDRAGVVRLVSIADGAAAERAVREMIAAGPPGAASGR